MKILHTVEFYYPSIGGAQEVIRQLSEHMVKLGHEVTVATTKLSNRKDKIINGVKIVEFDISGNEVRGYKGKTWEYKDFLLKYKFDIIMNYAAQQWATDLFFEVIDKINSKKIFVPCGFSELYNPAYKAYFKKMSGILKKYNAVVYLSENYRDINFVRKYGLKNGHIIPNGAGTDEFIKPVRVNIKEKFGIHPDAFLIISVGSHTGTKGHRELFEIFKSAKINNSVLLLIANEFGDGCTKECNKIQKRARINLRFKIEKKRFIVEDLTRKETIAAYQQADLFLFASNIEASPLVLFESAASKTAFLTTDVGNSKEIIQWTRGGMLMDSNIDKTGYSHVDIKDGAYKLERLYKDPDLRKGLAEQGFDNWKKRFTWEIIFNKYLELYRSL